MSLKSVHLFVFTKVKYLVGTQVIAFEGKCGKGKFTYMDFIIQCTSIDVCTVRTPADRCDRAPDFENSHRMFAALVTTFPNPHCPVVTSRRDELYTSSACNGSIERVNNPSVCSEFSYTFTSREVGDIDSLVC